MIAALDVAYGARGAVTACVFFRAFGDPVERASVVTHVDDVEPYEPGAFYKRELPCLLAALREARASPEIILVDGYVWLSADGRRGLGAHLFDALDGAAVVVGVAKTGFAGSTFAKAVLRGGSVKPLYVTAAGVDVAVAAAWVRGMAGPHRIPTLLGRADRLCREALR